MAELPAKARPGGDLVTRTLSALLMAPVALAATYFGTPYFEILVAIGAGIALGEWSGLRLPGVGKGGWITVGFAYIVLPGLALVWLRAHPTLGLETVFWLMAVVWATDIGAYAAGRLIGGPKLAPALSPKKTWAGLLGGMACAAAVGIVTADLVGKESGIALASLSAATAALAQGGDLFESWVKRRSGAKDSGTIIPGHGGILDRIDGLLAAAAAIALIELVSGGKVLAWL